MTTTIGGLEIDLSTRTIPLSRVVLEARGLVSEHGENAGNSTNPEYDRALVNLVTDLIGVPVEFYSEVCDLIGVSRTCLSQQPKN